VATNSRELPAETTIGIDTGGTFTDLVAIRGSEVRVEKVASTPDDPSRALLDGLARLGSFAGRSGRDRVVHGTTVALNALLTGRVARTALVTNLGFADLIEIARQDRPELYALHPVKTRALVPRELRFEVAQRSAPGSDGAVVELRSPTARELARLRRELAAAAPDSIAICLLHSYADPAIEERVARSLRGLGVPITTSAGLHPEHREFERFSTAVVNAALVPVVRGYLERLASSLGGARLELLRSSGGTISAERAASEPVRVLLSGPAGGVVGASRAAREAGCDSLVGLDMGGTSTDVAFRRLGTRAAGHVGATTIGGHPIAVPALDLHTIGCGGGSLLRVDSGGALRVGPQSAGADPGPVAYGRSEEPTVTDAHVLLGHVAPGAFLSGRLELDGDAVERAFERLARKLGTTPRDAALAALDVARAAMRRAIAAMTMQRGEDPRRTPLVAFGGAGGLHASALATALGMPRALVPRGPGVLSALGMAAAERVAERSRSVLGPLSRGSARERSRVLRELAREATAELVEAGERRGDVELEASAELRYVGQGFELRIPMEPGPAPSREALEAAFHSRHRELYGYALEDRDVELVNLRLRAVAARAEPRVVRVRPRETPREAFAGRRIAWFADRGGRAQRHWAQIVDRSRLPLGAQFDGPAIVEEFSGTTLVPPGARARVTHGGHLELTSGRPGGDRGRATR
jgi:N-methylhydantoinase A